ncbi:MAG: RsfS/YbeB/iojap family protein [Gemmatimonadota bacterium]
MDPVVSAEAGELPDPVRRAGELALEQKEGERPEHGEGMGGGRWVLLDYVDFVVPVFHPQSRDFYQLEALWGDAPRLEMGDEVPPS